MIIDGITTLTGIEVLDGELLVDAVIVDGTDKTKRIQFDLTGITSGSTYAFILPDSNIDLTPGSGTFAPAVHTHLEVDITDLQTYLLPTDIGITVQAYDANTSKLDVAQSWSAVQNFPDTMMNIVDDGDATKILNFQISGITTGNTRIITMPDQDINLSPGGSFAASTHTHLEANITDLQSYLLNIIEDVTPQLGGNLDVNGNSIVSVGAGDINITPDTTGDVVLDGLKWPQNDGTVGQAITTNGLGQLVFSTIVGGGVLTTQTTTAVQTTIGSVAVTNDTSLTFIIRGHGRENDTGDTFSSEVKGCIRNESTVTSLVGEVLRTTFNNVSAAAWDVTAVANDGTDTLDIKVTGEAGKTIDWKLLIETIEE